MTDQQNNFYQNEINHNNDQNNQYLQQNEEAGIDMNDLPVEMHDQDEFRNNMQNYLGMGFDKKLRQIKPKTSKRNLEESQQQQNGNNHIQMNGIQNDKFQSIDAKAFLITPPKGLSQYQSKTGVDFLNQEQILNGEPIPMISYNENTGNWSLTEKAMECIASVNGPVSFISIYGQSFSGKSFLMNQILKTTQNQKFKSNHDDQSTRGIMMWNTPCYNAQTNSYLFFLDTQEFQNEQGERDEINSSILFFINSLISQTMLVNVVGKLGSNSFTPLKDLHQLNEYIQIDSPEQKEELGNILPRILYVLRDHDETVKQNGAVVAMQTYFDNFLFSDDEYHKANPFEQKIRKRIVKYLRQRDAISLVKPVQEEEKLENIEGLQEKDLDEKFQEELKGLRKKIFYHARKKEFRGVFFSPTMTISFIQSIIEDINNREKIDLDKAFSIMIENEFVFVYNQSIDMYNDALIKGFSGSDQYKGFYYLNKILRDAREATYDNFYSLKAHDMELAETHFKEYFSRLKTFIEDREQEIIELNHKKQKEAMDIHVQNKHVEVSKLTSNNNFSIDDLNTIKHQYQSLIQEVMLQCLGSENQQYTELSMKNPIYDVVCVVQDNLSKQILDEITQMQNLSQQDKNRLSAMQNEKISQEANLNKNIQQLQNNERQLKDQIKQKDNNITQKDQQIKQLNGQINENKKEIKTLQDQKATLEGQLKESKAKEAKCC